MAQTKGRALVRDHTFDGTKHKKSYVMPVVPNIAQAKVEEKGSMKYNKADSSIYVSNGQSWVQVGGGIIQVFENITVESGLTIPKYDDITLVPPEPEGSLAYDRATDAVYVSTGSAWVRVDGGADRVLDNATVNSSLVIPRYNDISVVPAGAEGALAYDRAEDAVFVSTGSAWTPVYRDFVPDNITYYVNNSTGSDTNDGLTPATALLTFNKAMDVVQSRGWDVSATIILDAPGAYPVTVTTLLLREYGRQERPLIIKGYNVDPVGYTTGNVFTVTATTFSSTATGYYTLTATSTQTYAQGTLTQCVLQFTSQPAGNRPGNVAVSRHTTADGLTHTLTVAAFRPGGTSISIQDILSPGATFIPLTRQSWLEFDGTETITSYNDDPASVLFLNVDWNIISAGVDSIVISNVFALFANCCLRTQITCEFIFRGHGGVIVGSEAIVAAYQGATSWLDGMTNVGIFTRPNISSQTVILQIGNMCQITRSVLSRTMIEGGTRSISGRFSQIDLRRVLMEDSTIAIPRFRGALDIGDALAMHMFRVAAWGRSTYPWIQGDFLHLTGLVNTRRPTTMEECDFIGVSPPAALSGLVLFNGVTSEMRIVTMTGLGRHGAVVSCGSYLYIEKTITSSSNGGSGILVDNSTLIISGGTSGSQNPETSFVGTGNTRYGLEITGASKVGILATNTLMTATGTLGDTSVGLLGAKTWNQVRAQALADTVDAAGCAIRGMDPNFT